MRLLATTTLTAALLALAGPPAHAAPPTATLVVDDDRAQCAQAGFTSIQAAVHAAPAGSLVRVCPGRYPESVTITKPLTLKGQPDAVEAIDCFESTLPPVDAAQNALIEPPGGAAATVELAASGVDVSGFVIQDGSAGIATDERFSGYRVHHNLISGHVKAALLRSDGVSPSSLEHNCLRDNGWGVANEWLALINARIHHNATFRTANYAYEQTGYCPEFLETGLLDACSESRTGMERVDFDHNVSAGDDIAFRLASSASTRILDNTVTSARIGMRLFGANQDLRILANRLQVQQVGVARPSTPGLSSNPGALLEANTITGAPGTGAGIGMGAGGLTDSRILDNTISGFAGEGLVLLAANTGNLVSGNTVADNGSNGIRVAAGATGNRFEANSILGNAATVTGAVDARDDARAFNTWHGNVCTTDRPAGTICGL